MFKLDIGGSRAMIIGDVFHHLLQVFYPDWNFPKNSNADDARASRRRVLEECAASGAMVFPATSAPFAGHIEKVGPSFRPRFQNLLSGRDESSPCAGLLEAIHAFLLANQDTGVDGRIRSAVEDFCSRGSALYRWSANGKRN